MGSFILTFHQYSTDLNHLTCMVHEIRGKWANNKCFPGCCFQDLYKTTRSFPSSFISEIFVRVQEVQQLSNTNEAIARKKYYFILSEGSDFHMNKCLLIAFFLVVVNIDFSWWNIVAEVCEMLDNFRGLPFNVEFCLSCLKTCTWIWQVYKIKGLDHLCSLHLL